MSLSTRFCDCFIVRGVNREEHRTRASDLISSSFDPKLKTYFTSHGWKGSDPKGRTSAMKNIVSALIEKVINIFTDSALIDLYHCFRKYPSIIPSVLDFVHHNLSHYIL